MIILDTDIITILDSQSGSAFTNLVGRLQAPQIDRVCVTIVSFEEQMRGWLSYIAASRTTPRQVDGYSRLQNLLRWYQSQEVLAFDSTAAQVFDVLRRAQTRVGTMDLKIAAIAMSHGATLISRNLRDFQRVPGLQVEDWTHSL